jgi:hypothetical protein
VWWFVGGFLLTFLGILLFVRMYSMLPSGEAVVACPLWRYYVLAIQRSASSSGTLGPTTGSGSAAITTFVQHLFAATLGGAALCGIAVAGRKLTNRFRPSA